MTTRFLPVDPIRISILERNKHESINSMATRWAVMSGRQVATCNRLVHRILHEHKTISEENADEVCMYVLMSSGVAVYGVDGWSTDGHQSHDGGDDANG